jgi:hypothetical protein
VLFSPYYQYCVEQSACQQYCKMQDRENQVFKAYLAVCIPVSTVFLGTIRIKMDSEITIMWIKVPQYAEFGLI